MSQTYLFNERFLAAILACLLSSMVLLGSSSSPPLISISTISGVENGTIVRVEGILVDLKLYDSGAEGLIVADMDTSSTVKAVSLSGLKSQPSEYARIGDELLIKGEVSVNGSSVVVFTNSNDVAVSRASELVLTVHALSRNWFLFEGDEVRVRGIIDRLDASLQVRLRDLSSDCSIEILPRDLNLVGLIGSTVTLTATVNFDYWMSALTLIPLYVTPER